MNANELAELIEHLENARYVGASKAATMLRQQQAEIEALKQIIDANNLSQNIGQFVKPAKTLTEDEIREVADSVCHTWKKNGVGELYMEDFARAILRKAQEK
jgi:DNA-binding protein H-NS